jgi:Transglutaminase-like superfamily
MRAVVLVAAIRLALWTFSFRFIRAMLGARRMVSKELADRPVNRLAWAVQAAARRIPGASCLTQALALQYLLARAGESAEVRVGVRLSQPGKPAREFESHAWVEHHGKIILGNNGELECYSPILTLRPSEEG